MLVSIWAIHCLWLKTTKQTNNNVQILQKWKHLILSKNSYFPLSVCVSSFIYRKWKGSLMINPLLNKCSIFYRKSTQYMSSGKLFDIKRTVGNGISLESSWWLENKNAVHNEIFVFPCYFQYRLFQWKLHIGLLFSCKVLNCEIRRKMEIGKY